MCSRQDPDKLQHSNIQPIKSDKGAVTDLAPALQKITHPQRLAFLLPNLGGGGVQRNALITASALRSRGYQVELVLCSEKGPLSQKIPDAITRTILERTPGWRGRLHALWGNPALLPALTLPVLTAGKPSRTLRYLPALTDYLRHSKPDILFAATTYQNIEAILARNAARVKTRIAVTQSTNFSSWHQVSGEWRRRHLLPLFRRSYNRADAIIAVSNAVADDLACYARLNRNIISTIYTPLVPTDIKERAAEPTEHPWFENQGIPIILAVGRPGRAKDYPTLLRAFALLHKKRRIRLIILGEVRDPHKNQERIGKLQTLISELGVSEDVDMPGYTHNPYRYMARAALLVLSSVYEGFPSVVPEALACGCPVVSTRCPGGVAEALDEGRYGRLVPVGDDRAMADAINATLDNTPPRDKLMERGASFSIQRSTDAYEALVASLTGAD